jgi:hypothetical protein
VTIAPDHVRALSGAARRLGELLGEEGAEAEAAGTAGAQAVATVLDFFSAFQRDYGFLNCTALELEVEALPAGDGPAVWSGLVPPGSNLQIPQDHVEAGRLRLRAGPQAEWGPPLSPLDLTPAGDGARVPVRLPDGGGGIVCMELAVGETSASVHVPWRVQNLLPCPIDLTLWEAADGEDALAADGAPALQLSLRPEEARPVAFDLRRGGDLGLALGEEEGLAPARPRMHFDFEAGRPDVEVDLVDGAGRVVRVRAILLRDGRACRAGPSALVLCPHVVLVNWTGLPLLWGRCRAPAPSPAPARGSNAAVTAAAALAPLVGLEVAAGQVAQGDGPGGAVFGAGVGLSRQGGRVVRSAAMRAGTAWNARRPAALLFSLPDEPGWDPCVSLRGAADAAWRRVAADADDAVAGGGGGGLRDGEAAHRSTFGLSLPATVGRGDGGGRGRTPCGFRE